MSITLTRRIILTGRDGSDFNTTESLELIHRFKQNFPRNAKWRKFINTRKASRALIYLIVLTKSGMRIQGRRRKLKIKEVMTPHHEYPSSSAKVITAKNNRLLNGIQAINITLGIVTSTILKF